MSVNFVKSLADSIPKSPTNPDDYLEAFKVPSPQYRGLKPAPIKDWKPLKSSNGSIGPNQMDSPPPLLQTIFMSPRSLLKPMKKTKKLQVETSKSIERGLLSPTILIDEPSSLRLEDSKKKSTINLHNARSILSDTPKPVQGSSDKLLNRISLELRGGLTSISNITEESVSRKNLNSKSNGVLWDSIQLPSNQKSLGNMNDIQRKLKNSVQYAITPRESNIIHASYMKKINSDNHPTELPVIKPTLSNWNASLKKPVFYSDMISSPQSAFPGQYSVRQLYSKVRSLREATEPALPVSQGEYFNTESSRQRSPLAVRERNNSHLVKDPFSSLYKNILRPDGNSHRPVMKPKSIVLAEKQLTEAGSLEKINKGYEGRGTIQSSKKNKTDRNGSPSAPRDQMAEDMSLLEELNSARAMLKANQASREFFKQPYFL